MVGMGAYYWMEFAIQSGSAFAYENAAPEGMSIQGGVLCKYYLYAAKKYKHSITNAMRQRQ